MNNNTNRIINIFLFVLGLVLIGIGILLLIQKNNTLYKITFIVDNTTYEEQVLGENDTLKIPNNPIKEGYDFIGWEINGNIVNLNNYKITSSTTITASFNEIPVRDESTKVVLFYTKELGLVIEPQYVKENEYAKEPDIPAIDNVIVHGWYLNDEIPFNFNTPITSDTELFLNYTIISDNSEEMITN